MDRLDKITILALCVCVFAAIGLLRNVKLGIRAGSSAAVAAEKTKEADSLELELNQQIYGEISSAIEQGFYDQAGEKLKEVMEKYPGRSFSHVYLARLAVKKGNLGEAIGNYRRAVEMNPDFIDKKTPFFVGDEIKPLVQEGLEKFSRERKLRPNDETVKDTLKHVYYLQRRMLGGCE